MPNFEISGVIGGNDFSLCPGCIDERQVIAVKIPPGTSLVLNRTRFCFNSGTARIIVKVNGGNSHQSVTNCVESTTPFHTFSNKSNSPKIIKLEMKVKNTSDQPIEILLWDGWWVKLMLK